MIDLMTTNEDEKVFVKDETLTIRDYETEEEDIVNYFENLEKGIDLEEALEKVLKLGVIASKSSQVGSQVDYIQKKNLNFAQLSPAKSISNTVYTKVYLSHKTF